MERYRFTLAIVIEFEANDEQAESRTSELADEAMSLLRPSLTTHDAETVCIAEIGQPSAV